MCIQLEPSVSPMVWQLFYGCIEVGWKWRWSPWLCYGNFLEWGWNFVIIIHYWKVKQDVFANLQVIGREWNDALSHFGPIKILIAHIQSCWRITQLNFRILVKSEQSEGNVDWKVNFKWCIDLVFRCKLCVEIIVRQWIRKSVFHHLGGVFTRACQS